MGSGVVTLALLLVPAHALRCELAVRVHQPSACVWRALRASPLRLSAAGGEGGGGDSVGDELS
jgi:hypothetical protein